jgi:uncharacterized protein involved in outer membrane biogenesis
MLRFLLKLALVLIVLVAGTAGIGWYLFHNESFLKSQLSSNSLKYTGRDLQVRGPLSLDLGRVTTLEASDVHFANAPWSDTPDMAAVSRLKISIDLSSLFDEQIVFPALSLEGCKVNLVRNEHGESNWDMGPESKPKPGPSPRLMEQLPVVFRNLQIQNCALDLASPKLEEPINVKVTSLSMQHLENDRWQSKADGSINEMPLSLDGWVLPMDAFFLGGPLDHDMKVVLGEITLQSSGSVKDAKTWEGANLTTQIKGPDIGILLEEFKLPPFSEGAFDYQLKLNTEGQMTKLDLDGDLGSVDISAKGELDRLIKPSKGNIEFAVDGPNLGALAKLFGIDGLVEEPFSHDLSSSFEDDGIHIKKATLKTDLDQLEIGGHFNATHGFSGTSLDIHFQSDEVGRWTTLFGQPQQKLGPLDLDGTLSSNANGLFSISAKAAQGATTLNADGTLGHFPDAIHPDLNIAFSSPDASHLAAIAGLKTFPAAPLAINGQLGMKDKQVQLGKVNINLEGDQADIDGFVNLENHYAGSELSAEVNIQNAGDFGRLFGQDGLPDQPIKLGVEVKPDGKGLAFRVNDGNLGKIQLDLDGKVPDLQKPMRIDGNFNISLPRLSDIAFLIPDTKLPDAPFTAEGKLESKDNAVRLNNVIVKLAGDQATFNGHINLENNYAGSDLRADLDIKNAGALGRLFGQDGLPDEPIKIRAEVRPNGKGLAFELNDGDLRDIQVEVKGQIADMSQPMVMDADFDIQLPQLSAISFLFPDLDLPDVPFTAQGRLKNQKTLTRLEQVQIKLGRAEASIDGDLLSDNSFDLSIKAEGPDASPLGELLEQPLEPDPFSLAVQIKGSTSNFDLTDLHATLGQSQVNGNLNIGLGEITRAHGTINSPNLDLSQWIAEDEAEQQAKKAGKSPKKRQWVFDNTPVMATFGEGFDVDVDINISRIDLGNTQMSEFSLGLILSENLVELNPFTFVGLDGGVFQGEARLDNRGTTPQLHLTLHGNGLRVGLAALPGQDPLTLPPVQFDLEIDGAGETRRELASSVDGKLRAYLGSGQVAQAGLSLLFSDFLTELFTALNPFAKTSEYTNLDCSVVAADVVSGKVDVFPVIIQTEDITILSAGTIDLNTEKIDLSFNTKARKGIGISASVLINPLIKVGGTLAAPAIQMDPAGAISSGALAVATVGISLLAKSVSDRFLSTAHPCEDARKEIDKRDNEAK